MYELRVPLAASAPVACIASSFYRTAYPDNQFAGFRSPFVFVLAPASRGTALVDCAGD